MVVPADQTLLFTLPLELRQLIYKTVLASSPHGTELLRTCREIYLESHKFLFEKPLSFRSQLALFDWMDRVPHKYLPYVRVISLNVQDVDLRSLLSTSALVSHLGDPPRLLTWDLYERELVRLRDALRRLPKIQVLTVGATSGRQSFLYREYVQRILIMLTSLYPDVAELSLIGNFHHQSLSFLSDMKNLEAFSFDGFSASSPIETAEVLAGLHHLTSLSLVSQSTMLSPDSYTNSDFTTKRQSLTGGVVSSMDSLIRFAVTEVTPVSASMLFFTPAVLNSLQKHQALTTFRVCLSQAPSEETLTALESFLESAQIKSLGLDWPDLEPSVIETFALVPNRLQELWLRAKSAAAAFDIIWSIVESQNAGGLDALCELVLVRSTRTYVITGTTVNDRKDSAIAGSEGDCHIIYPNDTDAIDIGRAQACLQALGVRVSWFTEQP